MLCVQYNTRYAVLCNIIYYILYQCLIQDVAALANFGGRLGKSPLKLKLKLKTSKPKPSTNTNTSTGRYIHIIEIQVNKGSGSELVRVLGYRVMVMVSSLAALGYCMWSNVKSNTNTRNQYLCALGISGTSIHVAKREQTIIVHISDFCSTLDGRGPMIMMTLSLFHINSIKCKKKCNRS